MSPSVLRIGLVLLLLGGAYFGAERWLACAFPLGFRWYPELWRVCSFGFGDPVFERGGPGPLWPRLVVGALYLLAAAYVARGRLMIAPARKPD